MIKEPVGGKRMKKWLIVIGIIAILLIGGFFVLSFFAVKLIQPQLQRAMGPGLTISEIKVKATHLSVKGIQYEDIPSKRIFLEIEEMRIYPNFLSLLKGPLKIREFTILKPSFFFYRSREGALVGPWMAMGKKEQGKEVSNKGEDKEKESIHIKIDRFRIQKGSVDFEDMKTGGPPAQIKLREIDLDIRDLQYPMISTHVPIELKGKMKGKVKDGNIYTKGWIDPKTMDMETFFKVQEIELKVFEPYYRKKVSAEIDSGYVDMETHIALKKKMIDAPGQLEFVDLRIKEGGGKVLWIPANILVSLLKNKGNQIKIKFHVKGNMDDPQFSLQETFLVRTVSSLAEALGIPIKGVGELLFGGTKKGEEGLVEGLKSIEKLLEKRKEKKR